MLSETKHLALSEEKSISSLARFFTSLRSVQNDNPRLMSTTPLSDRVRNHAVSKVCANN